MITQQTKDAILLALKSLASGDLPSASANLFSEMGYSSERVLPGQTGTLKDFYEWFGDAYSNTQTEHTFRNNTKSIHILFQLTDHEINQQIKTTQFEASNSKSFVFAAVQLSGDSYSRRTYADFTREVNKRLPHIHTPVVVLFRTANNHITLALVYRRPHKRDNERAVLGNVSLVRQIDPTNPHRAHREILYDLSMQERLYWIDSESKPRNFDALLVAWLHALDTEELNKRFYDDLYSWYVHTLEVARFPTDQTMTLQKEEHVIRLIARMMFVWFIKENGLVADELFNENQVAKLLINYDRTSGDSYYRAVLQNLFFAILNTEVESRRCSTKSTDDHRNPSLLRYNNEIADIDELKKLFNKTPFINGGLFECLDSFDETQEGGYRIDCFSDIPEHYSLVSVPNHLFFNTHINLGLIGLFKHYKFTLEENTPTELEVALDPELLGKVFENLLATVNPETQTTSRQETGSYYTPRTVVDYMVDEAIVTTLTAKVFAADNNCENRKRLHHLIDHSYDFDEQIKFTNEERECIVQAVAHLTVLDPAIGSGAFPMGILHKLTLMLQRLDPNNNLWERVQREISIQRAADAFTTDDQKKRDFELTEISATFQRYRDSDFGRKLFLIQNSIYGVDIQPIAIQIAKLRFFITLAIEQQSNTNATDNYGIKPLPNLETRFVTADTLMPLYDLQHSLISDRIRQLELSLQNNREQHFHANTRAQKMEHRRKDKNLRQELASELRAQGLGFDDASKVAQWDPYDQNAAAAQWFDAAYMFGVPEGFDIIIGNPPYRQIRKRTYPKARFPFSEGRDRGKQNLYKLFVEQSYNLCKHGGMATLIVQSSLMCDLSSAATRLLLLSHTQLRHVIEFPKAASTPKAQIFQSVTQGTCIYQFTKSPPSDCPVKISVGNDATTIDRLRFVSITRTMIDQLYPALHCFPRISQGSIGILKKVSEDRTIKPLHNFVSGISQGDLNLSTHSKNYSYVPSPVRLVRGRHIGRFVVNLDACTEYCDRGFLQGKVEENRRSVFLISQQVTGTNDVRRLHFGLAEGLHADYLCGHSVNKTKLRAQEDSKMFLALLNSRFMDWFFRITSSNNNVQGYELEQLPIPVISDDERVQIIELVDLILEAKASNPSAKTAALEAKIDCRVYALYGLTKGEIAVVEMNN